MHQLEDARGGSYAGRGESAMQHRQAFGFNVPSNDLPSWADNHDKKAAYAGNKRVK